MANSTPLQIQEQIGKSNRIFLTAHKNPDGDALGSLLAFFLYLKSLNKEAVVFLSDVPPRYFDFLPSFEQITRDEEVLSKNYDLIIVFDSSDPERTKINPDFFENKKIIDLDHHVSNQGFGDFNLIDAKASSTSEIVFHYLKEVDFVLDKKIATCLLTGILDDTGGLANGATSEEAIKSAADLIRLGAKINLIAKKIANNKSFSVLKLWGIILSRLEINRKWGLAHTYVQEEELENCQVADGEIDGLANFLNILAEVKAVVFFRIQKDGIRASLRTTRDEVDVSALAGIFNGGGHKKAAGFTAPKMEIPEILEKIGPKV